MALVYGVLGLIVILTAGTFGTINASPWFNLAIAVVFVAARRWRCSTSSPSTSRASRPVVGTGGAQRGSLTLAFGMGAVAALLAGACVAPVVIQVVLFSSDLYARGTAIALALPFLLGVGMACRGRLPAPASRRCPSPARGWCASSRSSAWSSSPPRPTTATSATRCSPIAGSIADAVTSSVEEKLKATAGTRRWRRAGRRRARAEAGARRPLGHLVQELPDDGQDDAGRSGGQRRRWTATSRSSSRPNSPTKLPAREVMQRFEAIGLPTYVILRPRSAAGTRTSE